MKIRKKMSRYSRNALLFTCLVLGCGLLLNLIVTKIGEEYPLKIDMTRNRIYALTEDTERIVSHLEKPVTLYMIESEQRPMSKDTVEVVDRYQKASAGKIKVESVDISQSPTFSKQFNGTANLTYGTIVISCGDRFKTLNSSDFTSEKSKTYTAENKMTNAILYVTSDETQKIYFTTGHSEKEYGTMEMLLNQSYYTIDRLQLLTSEIPSDAQVLICISPKTDFSAEEIEKLDQYLERGGKAQFYFDVGAGNLERLTAYLEEWGITLHNDYLYESDANHFYGSGQTAAINIIPTVEDYLFTAGLSNNSLMIMPFSRSLSLQDQNVKKADVVPLLSTSEKAYARTDFSAEGFSEVAEGDQQGSYVMSAMAVREKNGTETDVMVSGSSQLLLNSLMEDNTSYANGDYFLNSIAWMSQLQDAVKIRAKSLVSDTLTLSVGTGIRFTVIIFVIALAALVLGIVIWARRRFL